MGYTTDFTGSFTLTPPLNQAQVDYLKAFSESRRMERSELKCKDVADPLREAVGLPVGEEGCYCVFSAADGNNGQTFDPTITDFNRPPKSQPGLWNQWLPNDEGTEIKWNGFEKFYNYIEWMDYINQNFLKPWGITIDGYISWAGEDSEDKGVLEAKQGEISFRY
ncbi:hypothetical protein CYY_001510 [Polysphondylium violaceum]|uniref:Uncharacterized protein n=1 Tax=Polysphondylium violaceum TaxID=133409 RepID=A0A8J4VAI7_9MYCE|nr:hypothetical protein CYY_001510 [Polysphondylium violaceum]